MKNVNTPPTKAELMKYYRRIRKEFRAGKDTAQAVKYAAIFQPSHVFYYASNKFGTNEIIHDAENAGIEISRA